MPTTLAKTILAFSSEPYEKADLGTRFFADYYGLSEEPTTGRAAGCLAAQPVEHGYFGKDSIDIRGE